MRLQSVWNNRSQRLSAFGDACWCWYSWSEQTPSLERLRSFDFEWVLAGHGGNIYLPGERMHAEVEALLRWIAQRGRGRIKLA